MKIAPAAIRVIATCCIATSLTFMAEILSVRALLHYLYSNQVPQENDLGGDMAGGYLVFITFIITFPLAIYFGWKLSGKILAKFASV